MGGFMEEADFEEMWKALQADLPNSFRFTGTKSDALAVREIFKQRYVPAIAAKKFEGKPVPPPEAVSAFPDELVWHMKTHKKVIRRHAPFADFQKFLVAEAASGNISRQEVVSMIPPHFLDVKPGMVVLDMCAAPGSKSAQLAEMIHGDEEERVRRTANGESMENGGEEGDYSDDGRSTGLLIANDSDYKRAGMLVHQVKRLNFPNLIVTQHDASIFPSIELPNSTSRQKQYLKYDRILADVPCSGDGTARKNPNVWQKWTPKDGLGLHGLQLRILFRGLQMLKKGGRMVYSTCSMNPVENEAVVAAAIEACGGNSKVQLLDCSALLPNLKRRPGLNVWKVLDTSQVSGGEKTAHMFTSWDAFQKAKAKYGVEEPERSFSTKITAGCFPPISKSPEDRIPLERCIRVYPHLQDTGAFFIAIVEKLDDIKVTQVQNPENTAKAQRAQARAEMTTDASVPTPPENVIEVDATKPQSDSEVPDVAATLKRKLEESEEIAPLKRVKTDEEPAEPTENGSINKEDSTPVANGSATAISTGVTDTRSKPENQSQNKEYFEYLPADDPVVTSIMDFFGISERFPRDRFMVKNKEGLSLNKIYYTSAFAKTILQQNKDRGMKFIHCGVIMFVAHKIKDKDYTHAPWRLQTEGIRILEPWASKRIINCTSKETLHQLIIEMFPKLPKEGEHGLGEVGDQLQKMDIGCCFVRVEKDDTQDIPFRMVLPLWRHPGSANLMVDKDDRKAMLLRLFNEQDTNIINHVADKAKAEQKAREEEKTALQEDDISDGEGVKEQDIAEEEEGDVSAMDVDDAA
jgi:multisite-specific tRNA:(cytosine-C5)-methyltransferase